MEREALKLAVDGLERMLGSFEADGKVVMKSMVRNELFAEMHLLLKKAKKVLAQPAQEPQYEYLIDDLAEWKQYVEVDYAPYGLREHVTKVLLAHGIKEKNNGT